MNEHTSHFFLKILVAAWILMTIITNCESQNDPITLPVSSDKESSMLELNEAQMTAGGIEMGTVSRGVFERSIRATGRLDVPPDGKASINTLFPGYAKSIHILPGQSVDEGELLFTLENPAYLERQRSFLESKAKLRFLKAEYERQQSLFKEEVTSKRNFLQAESEYHSENARYMALHQEISMMGINPSTLTAETIGSVIEIRSPMKGSITGVHIEKGMFVHPSEKAVTMINTDHYHVELVIFEKDIPHISIHQEVRVFFQTNPQMVAKASIFLIGREIDEQLRTVPVHAHLEEETSNHQFTPGMYLETDIITRSDSVWVLPNESFVEIDGKPYGFIVDSKSEQGVSYKKVALNLGRKDEIKAELLPSTNYSFDDEFMTKGVFSLIME